MASKWPKHAIEGMQRRKRGSSAVTVEASVVDMDELCVIWQS